tara:strand:+ start:39 stop:434 length:396 start_codon:yes stop_codon:yes gene_type:complete
MLILISLLLIVSILIFLIFYKKKYILNILKIKKFSSHRESLQVKKYKLNPFNDNLNYSDFIQLDNCSNFKKSILRKEMLELFKGSKKEKIKALKIAELLSDKSVLPILKLGLKDMDSDIIKVSAKLIQKYK